MAYVPGNHDCRGPAARSVKGFAEAPGDQFCSAFRCGPLAALIQSFAHKIMPVYIALLCGINVSGQRLVKMAELRTHCASFGALDIRTYIRSGNVVFEHRNQFASSLELDLEKHLACKLGYSVPTLVTPAEAFTASAARARIQPRGRVDCNKRGPVRVLSLV